MLTTVNTAGCDFSGGYVSGMVGLTVGHPFDTVKVIQQIGGLRTIESVKAIYKQNGVKGFFRGLAFPLLANGGINALFFGTYGMILKQLTQIKDFKWYSVQDEIKLMTEPTNGNAKARNAHFFMAGALGGLASLGVACPVEVVKIRLQTESQRRVGTNSRYGAIRCTYDIISKVGLKGLYRGFTPMAVRDVPGSGVYMMAYEILSKEAKELPTKNSLESNIALFVAGGMAGVASWWSVLPIDTAKSVIQADDPWNPKYSKNLITCMNQILKEHGLRRFFAGFWAISLRGFAVNGATFLSYELIYDLCMQYIKKTETETDAQMPSKCTDD